jgi:hypothetical protein
MPIKNLYLNSIKKSNLKIKLSHKMFNQNEPNVM